MSPEQIKTLREEFATLHAAAGKVLTAAAEAKRELSAEEKQSNDQRFGRMDAIKAQVDDAKRLAEYAFSQQEVEKPKDPKGKQEFDAEKGINSNVFDKESYTAALNHFARTGERSRQLFTISSGSGTGAFLPKEVVQPYTIRRLSNAFRSVLGYYGYPTITRTLTESISLPVQDDTGNVGQAQSETATAGTTADPDVTGSITLNPTLYSSKQLWFSNTTVNALDFDIFQYAMPLLDLRVDKAEESAWTTIAMGKTVGKTVAVAGAITYAELLALEHSLAPQYRRDMAFVLVDGLYQLVRGLVDNNNRPIMDLDPTNQFQATIHGKPVFISDYFQTMATTHKSGCVVSADAIKMMDAGMKRLARYVLVPAQPDQTGFELFANADCNFASIGIRLLANP